MTEPVQIVTGAAGLIGSSLVRHLLGQGRGRVVASDVAADPASLRDVLDRVDYVRADVGSFESVLRLFSTLRPRTVFHLGAMLGPPCEAAPQAGIQTNAVGTYHLLEAARLFGVEQVIFASSISVFGGAGAGLAVVDDDGLTRPDTVYAAAKLFSENLGLAYRRQHGLDFRSLRMPAVAGPGVGHAGFINYIGRAIEAAIDGRPYTLPVAPATRVPIVTAPDMARAFAELAAAPRESIRTVNYLVLGPKPVPSAQQLVERLQARFPAARLDFRVDPKVQQLFDALPQMFDDRRARGEWGWRPQHSLEDLIDAHVAAR